MAPIGRTIGISLALLAPISKCLKEAKGVNTEITNPHDSHRLRQRTIKYNQKTSSN